MTPFGWAARLPPPPERASALLRHQTFEPVSHPTPFVPRPTFLPAPASAEPGEGEVHREPVEGETTKTGEQKEHFGHGRAAQSEAGKKGGAISAQRPAEERQESARKAAETRKAKASGMGGEEED